MQNVAADLQCEGREIRRRRDRRRWGHRERLLRPRRQAGAGREFGRATDDCQDNRVPYTWRPNMSKRVCFFAKVKSVEILERVEFYAQDIRILRDLGYDVHIASSISEIRPADLYFVWWWTWAFAPLAWAKLLRRPIIVTGVFDLPMFPPRNAIEKTLMRAALRFADANVFCSLMEQNEVPAAFPTKNPIYVPLSVDTQLYAPSTEPRDNVILSVGWLQDGNSQRKGMPDVVQAAPLIHRAHPEVRFIIAGEHGTHYS